MPPITTPTIDSGPAAIGEDQLRAMAVAILVEIPGAEVRMYSFGEAFGHGSRARGETRPDSGVDLLITAPDAWLAEQYRFALLGRLWRRLARHRIPVDLLPYSRGQVEERSGWHSHGMARACREGRLLQDQR